MSLDTLNKGDGGPDQDRPTLKRLLAELSPKDHRFGAQSTGSVIDREDVVQGAIFETFEALPSAGAIEKSRGMAISHRSQSGPRRNAPKEAKGSELILSRRDVLLIGAVLPLAACAAQSERGGDTEDGYTFVDALPAARPIIESSEDMRAKVTRFRTEVLTPYTEPYGLLTPMDDATIADELGYLAERVDAYLQLSVRFPLALAESWRTFVEVFPATMLERAVVYLLPAPRRTVGGAVRPLGPDRGAVLFGSNQVIDSLASSVSISTLIHHELTHCYHIQGNPEIRQAVASFFHKTPGPPVKLYQMMWLEGLAGYVSKTLNPSATTLDVLSDANLPANVAAHWKGVISDMLENWDSTDIGLIDAFVGRGDARNIPSRSAYYVGMLVAARLAEHQSLPVLTALKGAELRDQVSAATRAVMAAGPPA